MSENLIARYGERRRLALVPLAVALEKHIAALLNRQQRIDRIVARAKSIDRFLAKASKKDDKGKNKYNDPLIQIQDQIGARIVTFYSSDIKRISDEVEKYFQHVESRELIPESESEFGYIGKHYIFFIPSDIEGPAIPKEHCPKFFELQVKTLFQHSWAEANHDLGYKPESPLTSEQKRRLAFTAAQAWGADMIFDELFTQTGEVKLVQSQI